MPMPVTFPDWMPWWLQLITVVVVILFGLAFLFMPFSVFGLKSRLEAVEARLDEIQGEIRSLALRLPEPSRGAGFDDDGIVLRAASPLQPIRARTPAPPATWETDEGQRGARDPRAAGRIGEMPRGRSEPRLERPPR